VGGLLATFLLVTSAALTADVAVTTYHNDANRTGWNSSESKLTPSNVNATSFGLLNTVTLDEQVDAQVLVVPDVNITAGSQQGSHDVAYVATENNTIYAIDVHSGAILLSPNFGKAVSRPFGCNENGPVIGITSTPVIDLPNNTLYVITYTNDGPTYRIHALDLGSLTDKVTPVVVSATHQLSDGSTYSFQAKYQRQRPALLLANGNIYAGFGSFCDNKVNISRGWLLGWQTGNLTPLGANQLLNTQATSPQSYFMTSIWMSGYGPAADESGNLFLITGNSDPTGTSYDGITNFPESALKIAGDTTRVLDLFTPSNLASLEMVDNDFGSGGVLVIPAQAGTTPHMAVAAGKTGSMYLLNRDNMGGYSATGNNVLGTYSIGACWCGQSYYQASDGTGRVISSGGRSAAQWKILTSPSVKLTRLNASKSVGGGQNPGFFTSISSNGSSTPIVWAVAHPITKTNTATYLYAFDASNAMATLFSGPAGSWPNTGGNANVVPTVANGQVFVATNKQLQIFGLKDGEHHAAKPKRHK
jgi:hypothetical protein